MYTYGVKRCTMLDLYFLLFVFALVGCGSYTFFVAAFIISEVHLASHWYARSVFTHCNFIFLITVIATDSDTPNYEGKWENTQSLPLAFKFGLVTVQITTMWGPQRMIIFWDNVREFTQIQLWFCVSFDCMLKWAISTRSDVATLSANCLW